MIPRQVLSTLHRLSIGFPIVTITGPRQSGKSTLAREAFPDKPYVSLESPDTLLFAESDPRGFLSGYPDGAILDEIQRCPPLFSYLQGIVDDDGRMGLFVLTGSAQFDLRVGITQSLAGRVGIVQLLPLSCAELKSADQQPVSIEETIFRGAYPALFNRSLLPADWYPAYVATYVERDMHQLIQVRDLSAFQRFLRMCANRIGQLVNLSSLANDCGITHNTAKAWISVLEASYIVFELQPHFRNFNKRLTKSSKLYFCDTGLASWLLGIQRAEQITAHAMRGALFENWVIADLLKSRFNHGQPSNLYFWRDSTGNEVDVLIENGERLTPVEIKSGQTLNSDYFLGLQKWCALAGDSAHNPTLVYAGNQTQQRSIARVIPWNRVDDV